MALDDSVQSFTQSNGINGPVYVDTTPERDEEKRPTNIDEIMPSDNRDSFKENFNTTNEIQSRKTPSDFEQLHFSIKTAKGNDNNQKLGALDILKEISTKITKPT